MLQITVYFHKKQRPLVASISSLNRTVQFPKHNVKILYACLTAYQPLSF